MTETIKHLESVLRLEKACILPINLGLVKLLTALQDLRGGFSGVDEDGPFTIADDKLMDGFAPLNLTLSGPQPPKEGFQVIVGAIALRPGIALEQARPALTEARADMSDHTGVMRTLPSMLFQLGQKLFDLTLDLLAGWARPALAVWGVETPLQFHQPVPLAFELPILRPKRVAEMDHRQQLRQEWMPPFLALRLREDSIRAKSSNTRRPPNAKGGLLASVRVLRINSA